MYLYRNRLMIISIVTLSFAIILTIVSLVTSIPLLLFFILLLISISMITDAIALHLLFRQKEGMLQLLRGFLLLLLFFMMTFQFMLNRF